MALLAVAGCEDGGVGPTPPATGASVTTSRGGEEITVTGRVSRVVDLGVFEIAGSDGAHGAEAVLVVDPQQRQPVRLGDVVEVSGTVRPFRQAVLEVEFGFRFQGAVGEFEGRSCLVASRLGLSGKRPTRRR